MEKFILKVQKASDIKSRIDTAELKQVVKSTPIFEADIDLLDIYDQQMVHQGTYKLTVGYQLSPEPCLGHNKNDNIDYYAYYWGVYLMDVLGDVTTVFENKDFNFGFCADPENCKNKAHQKQLKDISALISNEALNSISAIINDYNAKTQILVMKETLQKAEDEKKQFGTISFEMYDTLDKKIDELKIILQDLPQHKKEHRLIRFIISKAEKLMQ